MSSFICHYGTGKKTYTVGWGMVGWWLGLTGKGHERTSRGFRNVLYLDSSFSNTGICTSKNLIK